MSRYIRSKMSPLYNRDSRPDTVEERKEKEDQIRSDQMKLIDRAEALGTITSEEASSLRKEFGK